MNFRQISRSLLCIVSLSILCLLGMSWFMPVQAATYGEANLNQNLTGKNLETEVLKIIRSHPEVIIESFQIYQEQQKQQLELTRQAFLQKLKTDPQIIIGDSPVIGSEEQKIVLLEFSDFQCPFCARLHNTLKEFQETHPDEVTFVFKHLPIASIHPQAMSAAKAAWAAEQQGKFWQYHDILFEQQDKLGEELYLDIAKGLDLDLEQFNRDRAGVVASATIAEDIQIAQALGVQGTPFLVMNGEFISGAVPISTLEEILQKN